jgi:hypothetical protein
MLQEISQYMPPLAPSKSGPSNRNELPPCSPSLAAKQTRVLLGCYRKGEASDPEVYVTSVATVLTRYPETVVRKITHPVDGIPGKLNWLPTVAEVRQACEAEMKPVYDEAARQKRIEDNARLIGAPAETSTDERARAVAHWEDVRKTIGKSADEVKALTETPLEALDRLAEAAKTPVAIGAGLAQKLKAMRAA